MYRVKNDIRVLRSADALKAGLLRCMQDKPFNEVSVSDISRESGICRATFYRLFDTPTDVLSYACESFAVALNAQMRENRTRMTRDDFLRFVLSSWIDKADLIEAVVKSGRPVVLHRALQIIFKGIVSYGDQFTDDEKDYIQASLSAQFGSILFVWAQHGRRESPDFLLALFKRFAAVAAGH